MYASKKHPDSDVLGLSAHRKRTLSTLRKRLGIVSVRKNTSTPEERVQALLDIKADDIAGKWGVLQVRQHLANRGVLISRYITMFLFYINII